MAEEEDVQDVSAVHQEYRGKCYYEVLGVERDVKDSQLKKAYHKMAIKWHPDKNRNEPEIATETFKYVQNAYAVLNDRTERAWYDSHRDQILREARGEGSDDEGESSSETGKSWLKYFSSMCFTGFNNSSTGFFGVYSALFSTISALETDAGRESARPEFGKNDSPWEFVSKFYQWWGGFSSARTFSFVDEYDLRDAPNRDYRRAMEKENQKLRKEAKKEYNDTVMRLVEFVKRRDPRVDVHRKQVEQERLEKELLKEETRRLKEAAFQAKKEQWRLEQLQAEAEEEERLKRLIEEKGEEYAMHLEQESRGLRIEDLDSDDEWYGGKGKKGKKGKKRGKKGRNDGNSEAVTGKGGGGSGGGSGGGNSPVGMSKKSKKKKQRQRQMQMQKQAGLGGFDVVYEGAEEIDPLMVELMVEQGEISDDDVTHSKGQAKAKTYKGKGEISKSEAERRAHDEVVAEAEQKATTGKSGKKGKDKKGKKKKGRQNTTAAILVGDDSDDGSDSDSSSNSSSDDISSSDDEDLLSLLAKTRVGKAETSKKEDHDDDNDGGDDDDDNDDDDDDDDGGDEDDDDDDEGVEQPKPTSRPAAKTAPAPAQQQPAKKLTKKQIRRQAEKVRQLEALKKKEKILAEKEKERKAALARKKMENSVETGGGEAGTIGGMNLNDTAAATDEKDSELTGPAPPAGGEKAAAESEPLFGVGDTVFVPKPHQKIGVVTKVNRNGTYAVRYEDGTSYSKIGADNILPYAKPKKGKGKGKGKRSKKR